MDLNLPLQNQIYNDIKRRILSGEMEVDTFYSETRLAKELSVSRTPLRDALRYLEQGGYIVIVPSRGFKIRKLDREGLRTSIEIRCAIEGYCTYRATEQAETPEGKKLIEDLTELLEKMRSCLDDSDRVAEFIDYDHEFHAAITSFPGNQVFQVEMQKIHYLMRQTSESALKVEGRISETYEEHRILLDYIRMGDAVSAYRQMIYHLNKPLFILPSQ